VGRVVPLATDPESSPRPSLYGGAGTLVSHGRISDLDPNTTLRGQRWYGTPWAYGVVQQMLRDPIVRLSLASIANPVASARWDVVPASQDPLDREVADFVRWSLFECQPWPAIVRRMVLAYASTGVSVDEIADDVVRVPTGRFTQHPGGGFGVAPIAWEQRSARTIEEWIQSPSVPTRLSAVRQRLQGADEESAGLREIAADRIVRVTWEQDGADFAGFPLLRSAYGPWKIKSVLLTVEAIQHERHHVGVPKIDLPESATDDDRETAIKIAADLRANERGFLVLPHGWSAAILTTNGTTDIRRTIEAQDVAILRNVFAGFLALENRGAAGSYALASSLEGQHQTSLEAHPEAICAALNQGSDGWSIVERIVRLNYGAEVALPRVVARLRRSTSEVINHIGSMVRSGVLMSDPSLEDYVRDLLQIPPLDVDRATLRSIMVAEPGEPGLIEGEEPAEREVADAAADEEVPA
jgi:hypothetical protein